MENKNINLLKYEFSLITNKYSRLDILAMIFYYSNNKFSKIFIN